MVVRNISEAKAELSALIEVVQNGNEVIIAKAGKPLVKVMSLDTPSGAQIRRLGFLAGQIAVPQDFDRMGRAEIEKLFGDAE